MRFLIIIFTTIAISLGASARVVRPAELPAGASIEVAYAGVTEFVPDTDAISRIPATKAVPPSIYTMPYSMCGSYPNWHRMWINTAVLSGAFVSTLLVLECLPEDATTWNRAELQKDPPTTRWFKNVFKRGPSGTTTIPSSTMSFTPTQVLPTSWQRGRAVSASGVRFSTPLPSAP